MHLQPTNTCREVKGGFIRFPCIQNVDHFDVSYQQVVRDYSSMAPPPGRFRAHDGAVSGFGDCQELIQPGFEFVGKRVIGVVVETASVPEGIGFGRNALRLLPQASQFANPVMPDTEGCEAFRYRVEIVLGIGSGSWDRSDVRNRIDAKAAYEFDELFQSSRRMPDCIDGEIFHNGKPAYQLTLQA